MTAKVTLVKIANYDTLVCDEFHGDVSLWVGVCMLHCSEVESTSKQCNIHQQGPTNKCSHNTTELITHRYTIIGYFNKF